ncbi:doublesex- and mab-3-related transcription factor C1-like [Ochotona princeps]|uniref:doublesex- and mab-3-related transcription factor C1-like n=1 Tax=Ochotona princeps TaxID=9978 RepID=UPI002714D0B5|nr:doublesex- and mab-3-related transcription factor C1-like [Ochotona princeps]
MGQEHISGFQACQCPNCVFLESHNALPAATATRKEQAAQIKKQLVIRVIKNMAIVPGAPVHVKNMARLLDAHNEKVNTNPHPQACCWYIHNLETLPRVLHFSQPQEPTFPSYASVTTETTQVFAVSEQPQGPPLMPDLSAGLMLWRYANLDSHLLQPQLPQVSEPALVASPEWQRKLEAAEALLTLRNFCPVPYDPMPVSQACSLPTPAEDKILQTPISILCPRPTTSKSPPIGHLD